MVAETQQKLLKAQGLEVLTCARPFTGCHNSQQTTDPSSSAQDRPRLDGQALLVAVLGQT